MVPAPGSPFYQTAVMAGLVPAIHVFPVSSEKTWMPGTRPGMTTTSGYASSPQHRPAALDDGDVARLHLRLERNHVAVLPEFHGHGLAGVDRGREPRGMLPEGGGIIVGIGLQYTAAGDAVGAHSVQDRPRETGTPGEFRIAVQRIAIAAQPVDQRLVRPRRDLDGLVGRAGRHLVRLGLAFRRAAEAAIAACKARCHQRRQLLALVVPQHRLMPDYRTLVPALVEYVEHGGIGGDMRRCGERLVKGDVTFAIDHHDAVEIHLAGSGAPGRDRSKGRNHLEGARRGGGLIDEGELPLVQG